MFPDALQGTDPCVGGNTDLATLMDRNMSGIQMTFDDLPPEANLNVMSPDRLFEIANAELLTQLREDNRFERKGPNAQPRSLGEYFSMWANTTGGGLLVVGQQDNGTLLGLSALSIATLNRIEQTAWDHCPEAVFQSKRVPFVRPNGEGDFVLLFYVQYHPSKAICTSDGQYFIRIGDQKRRIKDDEIRQLRLDKGEISVEREGVDLRYPEDFDLLAARVFAESVRKQKALAAYHSLEDILELQHLGQRDSVGFKPNLACALLFAKDILAVVPGCRIRLLRFEGEEEGTGAKWNAVKDMFIEGTLPEQIRKSEEALKSQLRSFSRLGAGGKFFTAPEYPDDAWYEAIVNACVHRTYSNGLRNSPIFVKMFDDRLEVESPGPFPPFVTPQNIYEVHSPRNPHLMNAMYFMDFVKCAHEGTRRIRMTMKEMALPAPEFMQQQVGKALVRVTLRNNIKQRKVWVDADVIDIIGRTIAQGLSEDQKRCINFVAEHGSISVSDAQRLTQKSWPAARRMLGNLVDREILLHEHRSDIDRDPKARFILARTPKSEL